MSVAATSAVRPAPASVADGGAMPDESWTDVATRAAHRTLHGALAAAMLPGNRLWHAALDPRGEAPSAEALAELSRRVEELIAADEENVRLGHYPRELLFQIPLVEYMTRVLPEALLDAPRLLLRRYRDGHADLPDVPWMDSLPRYYRRTFHWQTDGWLSDRSARLYDGSVEFLFGGMADVMRRMALPAVVRTLRESGEAHPRVVDLACGTGRFLLQLSRARPDARLYGVDLSPPYLAYASRLLADHPDTSFLRENVEAVPLADGSADCVTSVFLFHELPKPVRRRVVAEAYRLVRPGGRFVVLDSAQLSDSRILDVFLRGFSAGYHEPFYGGYIRDDLGAVLSEAGFEIEESRPWLVSKLVVGRKPGGTTRSRRPGRRPARAARPRRPPAGSS